MKLKGSLLTEEEQERIHQETLRILMEVGIKVYGEKALAILKRNGALVDSETRIARIPEDLIQQALSTSPRSFVLGARNPVYDYPLPSPVSRYCLDGTAAFAQDFQTGERRYGTRKDIENGARVFQQMNMGVMTWAPTCAADAPAHSRALHEFFTVMKYSSKHGNHELHTYEQVPYLVAGLEAILGTEDEIKRRNDYSLIYCPVAPLMHDGPMLDAYLELGSLGIPVMIMPMPVNGTTGPASLYSNLCLANAEALSSIVIFQLANPGRPMIYSSATGSIDFRKGAYLGGSPEMGLQSAGLTVMGQYYGLPSTSAGCTSDAKQPGPEAVLEKFVTTIAPVLVGSDIIVGFGEIESDQILILEQIVVDNEIAKQIERLYAGVEITESKNYFDDIARLGPGGNFLKARSTRTASRSAEFYRTDLVDHHPYETWINLGKPSLYANARLKVEEVLSEPVVDPLPEDVISKLDDILRKADKELSTV